MPARTATLPDHVVHGAGAPIVLLPGMEGAKEFWEPQLPALAPRYRVVACGYPRRGFSPAARVADYARDVVALLDHLAIESAAVVGESFGGMVAQELATTHPERVAALVLCNTFARVRGEHFGLNLFTLATLAQPCAFALPRGRALELLGWIGRHRGFVMDPTPGNRALAEYVLDHGWDPGLAGYLDRVVAGRKADYREALGRVTVPTLVLRGDEDRIVGEEGLAEIVEALPHPRVVRISGGGHCCQHTCPAETNRALLAWLDEIGY